MKVILAQKLLETLHLNVGERSHFPGNCMPSSVLVTGAKELLDKNGWLPSKLRPQDEFDGVIIEQRTSNEYWIHERHEIGVLRYSPLQCRRCASLNEAVQAYVRCMGGQLDGIIIDWDA